MEFNTVFVDPDVLLGKSPAVQGFVPKLNLNLNLGPSAPHDHDDEHDEHDDEPSPGDPPPLGADSTHYTDVLDKIWPEFDQPEKRTAERLNVLFEHVVKEAARMHRASQDFFASVPFHKIKLDDRVRFQLEFTKYLKRLNEYRVRFENLPATSIETDAIYYGLVQTRQGAGPVPDAIMHLYFRNQIGVLTEHVHAMSVGFVALVLDGLAALAELAREAREAIEQKAAEAAAQTRRWTWIVGGSIAVATTALLGGLVLAFRSRRTDEPRGSDEPT